MFCKSLKKRMQKEIDLWKDAYKEEHKSYVRMTEINTNLTKLNNEIHDDNKKVLKLCEDISEENTKIIKLNKELIDDMADVNNHNKALASEIKRLNGLLSDKNVEIDEEDSYESVDLNNNDDNWYLG